MDGQAVKDAPTIRFVDGELTGLRPVLAQDLETVVHLLNESPLPFGDNVPWTVARLKKKFEDEKEPGLWGEQKRWYVAVENGTVCGLLKEDQRRSGEVWLKLHFAESVQNRRELFLDALRTYVNFKANFAGIARINTELLDLQADELQWLSELGFIPQARVPEVWLHLGERRDYMLYSWIPEWVLAQRAPDGGAAE